MTTDGYKTSRIDCSNPDRFLAGITSALRWQETFGYSPDRLNLDALNDAFRSTPDQKVPRLLLVFDPFDQFWRLSRAKAHTVLDILEASVRDHLIDGYRLAAFVRTDDPDLSIEALGATAARWNAAE